MYFKRTCRVAFDRNQTTNEEMYDMHRRVHLATGASVEKHRIIEDVMEKAIRHVSS